MQKHWAHYDTIIQKIKGDGGVIYMFKGRGVEDSCSASLCTCYSPMNSGGEGGSSDHETSVDGYESVHRS